LKFNIDKSKIYPIEESFSDLVLEAFNDLIKCGYSGTIITKKTYWVG
jgi:hypothetical protein